MKVHFFLSQTAQFDKSINLFFSFLNNRIFVCSIFFTTDAISVHYFYIGYSTEVWGFLFLFFISSHFVKTLFIETSLLWLISQPANIGPLDVPRTSPYNVPRTSPKGPIWPSRGRPDLTSGGRPNLTSRGRLNLTFKWRSWEVDSGRPLEDPESTQTWMSNFFLTFLSQLIRLTKSKSISTL